MTESKPLYRLVQIVDRLLGPGGCPWDQAQTHESLKSYLLEEAYEVLDAIDSEDIESLKEELGDLILQPIMHAQMQKLNGGFDVDEVANTICEKLIRRHPHVFGNTVAKDPDDVLRAWDTIKKQEKGEKQTSVLDSVPRSMASLLRAHELSKRAARCGFEWAALEDVFDKLHEEEAELKEAIEVGDPKRIEEEVGDLLFTAVNLSRWCGVEPEEALRNMLDRFARRFREMVSTSECPIENLTPREWNRLWVEAKLNESSRATG